MKVTLGVRSFVWKCAHFHWNARILGKMCTFSANLDKMHAFSGKCAHFMQISWKCMHFMQIRWKCTHFHQNQDFNHLRFRRLINIGLSYIYERPIIPMTQFFSVMAHYRLLEDEFTRMSIGVSYRTERYVAEIISLWELLVVRIAKSLCYLY